MQTISSLLILKLSIISVADVTSCDESEFPNITWRHDLDKLYYSISACNAILEVAPIFDSCMYDMCACGQNLKDCLCPMLGTYAADCAAAGVNIMWRHSVPECGMVLYLFCNYLHRFI